jgi:hypothetical protein
VTNGDGSRGVIQKTTTADNKVSGDEVGRNSGDEVKGERLQFRISEELKARLEESWKRNRPDYQFQEFLLEMLRKGLKMMEIEESGIIEKMRRDFYDPELDEALKHIPDKRPLSGGGEIAG